MGPAIAVSGMLAATPVEAASAQATFLDLINALQGIAEASSRWSVPVAPPETSSHDVTLLGVVIAGPTRLALIQRAAGQELIPVGAALGAYRLVDVRESQAMLEGPQGERLVLRLSTGGGPAQQPATTAVEGPDPSALGDANAAHRAEVKERRAAERAQRAAEDKARALRERGVLPPRAD